MKKLAKILSVLLTVAMLFSLMACTVTPDAPNDGENNGEDGEDGEENIKQALYTELADKIVTSAITRLEEVKSVKFSVTVSGKSYAKENNASENLFGSAEVLLSDVNGRAALHITLISEAENMGITVNNVTELKLISGFSYIREYTYGSRATAETVAELKNSTKWLKQQDRTGITERSYGELLSLMKDALAGESLDEIKADIVGQLKDGGFEGGKLEWTYDAAPDVTKLLNYLKSIKETDTVVKLINGLISELGGAVTVEGIIAEIVSWDGKTVNQAFADIEAYTVAEGMGTLQEIWDGFVSSDLFEQLASAMGMPEEIKAEMKAIKLADILEVYGEYTVADVIYTLMASQSEEPEYGAEAEIDGDGEFDGEFEEVVFPEPTAPVLEAPEGFMLSLIGELTPILNITLRDMGTDVYKLLYDIFGIELDPKAKADKLAFTVSAEIDTESGEIKGVRIGADIDVTVVDVSYYESLETGYYQKVTRATNVQLKANGAMKEVSGEEATVAIPSADMIENDFDVPFYE